MLAMSKGVEVTNTTVATVNLEDVVPGTYMVYVKFGPPKYADWVDDYDAYEATNYNRASANDGDPIEAEAVIRVFNPDDSA